MNEELCPIVHQLNLDRISFFDNTVKPEWNSLMKSKYAGLARVICVVTVAWFASGAPIYIWLF
jgi:hypothetical protein